MRLNNHKRILTLKKVLTNNDFTVDVKKMYLIAFIECGSLKEIEEISQDEDKFSSYKERVDELDDSISKTLMDFSHKDWNDVSVSTLRDLVDSVHSSIK
jgi:hypothetical protein